MAGTPEEALATACGLYLGDPTACITPANELTAVTTS